MDKIKEKFKSQPLLDKHFITEGENLMENYWLDTLSVLRKSETGLPMNIEVDEFGCQEKELWYNTPRIKFQGNYADRLSCRNFIPLSISENPTILLKNGKPSNLKIIDSDMEILFDWIREYRIPLLEVWNQSINLNSDFMKIIGSPIKHTYWCRRTQSNFEERQSFQQKDYLAEMSNLLKSKTGLPMNIWIDEMGFERETEHNIPRIKFQKNYRDSMDNRSGLIPISISDDPQPLPKNTNERSWEISNSDLKALKDWIKKYKEPLMRIWNRTMTVEEFSAILANDRMHGINEETGEMELSSLSDRHFLTEKENFIENCFTEAAWYSRSETGLPMNIWIDNAGADSWAHYNVPRFKFQRTHNNEVLKEEMIPISISQNPQILLKGNLSVPINSNDLNIIKNWVKKHRTSLYTEWTQHLEYKKGIEKFNNELSGTNNNKFADVHSDWLL
jgi:hypothetical protein